MKIEEALSIWLIEDFESLFISRQKLFLFYISVINSGKYKKNKIVGLRSNTNILRKFDLSCNYLIENKVVFAGPKTSKGYKFFYKRQSKLKPLNAVCDLFPYGYLSFLTAMKFYNLTMISSESIYFTTFNRTKWKETALRYISSELTLDIKEIHNDFLSRMIPAYPVDQQILKNDLIVTIDSQLKISDFDIVQSGIRVQKMMPLLIDMTRKPQYCGGLELVLDIYRKQPLDVFEQLLPYLEKNGTDMDKARIGFICHKLLKIDHPFLNKWITEIKIENKRGSSRKLVSYLPFAPKFDDIWNISLNHQIVSMY